MIGEENGFVSSILNGMECCDVGTREVREEKASVLKGLYKSFSCVDRKVMLDPSEVIMEEVVRFEHSLDVYINAERIVKDNSQVMGLNVGRIVTK